jgi:hypothetical protein
MKLFFRVLPHLSIILSGMLLTFFIIDRVNTAMAFINNDITKWLIGISAVLSMIVAGMLIHCQRRSDKMIEKGQ